MQNNTASPLRKTNAYKAEQVFPQDPAAVALSAHPQEPRPVSAQKTTILQQFIHNWQNLEAIKVSSGNG